MQLQDILQIKPSIREACDPGNLYGLFANCFHSQYLSPHKEFRLYREIFQHDRYFLEQVKEAVD